MANIVVYIEPEGTTATTASLIALNQGRRIATRLGATIYALLPCRQPPDYNDEDVIALLARHGADKVLLATNPVLDGPPIGAAHGDALLAVCRRFCPLLVLFPPPVASVLGPRLAFQLRADFFPWVELDTVDDQILARGTIFGRSQRQLIHLEDCGRPLVLGLGLSFSDPPVEMGDEEAEVAVIQAPTPDNPRVELLSSELAPTTLAAATLVVAGGGGLADRAAFERVERLGRALGGTAAASHTACACGMAPAEQCVGLDGQAVNADLYLAFAISGSPRHLAALSPWTTVIAVNTDPEAPIMRVARHALIADAVQTLDRLLALVDGRTS